MTDEKGATVEVEGNVTRRHGSGAYVNPQALNMETALYLNGNMHDLVRKKGLSCP